MPTIEKERFDALHQRLGELQQQRQDWETDWLDIKENMLPEFGFFLGQGAQPNKASTKRKRDIIKRTGKRGATILASGMQGGLTSPARPWFRLGLTNKDLEERKGVKLWLHRVEQGMYQIFRRSNFYQAMHAMYFQLGGFGTAPVFLVEHPERDINCMPLNVGEYFLSNNMHGEVDTVARRFMMTYRQMAQQFGKEELSNESQKILERNPDQFAEVYHMVWERKPEERNPDSPLPKKWRFGSLYWEPGNRDSKVLSEGGFREWPIPTGRWLQPDSSATYGMGPGHDALSDVLQVQSMAKDFLRGVKKQIDPPVRVPKQYKDRLKTFAGGLNYVDAQQNEPIAPLYQVQPNLDAVRVGIQETEQQILESFFADLFLMASQEDRSNITAREISERHEEKLMILGPVIERLHSEVLGPIIDRTFAIMMRSGLVPAPPEEVQGEEIQPEYISMLAQAQQMSGLRSMDRFATAAGNVAQYDPEVLDKINSDRWVSEYAGMLDVPPSVLNSDEEVAQIRQQRAQQQQQQQRMEMMQQAGEAASKFSQASPGEGERQAGPEDILGGLL